MSSSWKTIFSVFILGSILLLGACGLSEESSADATSEGKIKVVTTIAQISEPISVIGGDRLDVEALMGPGTDPHLYKATQGDIQTLQDADIVFYNGLHLEGNMTEIFEQIGKTKQVLALGETIPDDQLLRDETGAIDPHIWFDIDLWMEALDKAVEELKEFSPDDASYFEENKKKYFSDIEALKAEAKEKLSSIPEKQRVLVTAHDAFGYFGRMHDMKVVGLQGLSTEDEIGVSDIESTIDLLMEYQVPAVFVESSINENSIRAVIEGASEAGLEVELGGELFSDAMGEPGSVEGTYLGMYRHNIETIYHALKEGK